MSTQTHANSLGFLANDPNKTLSFMEIEQATQAGHESVAQFHARISESFDTDIDLDAIVQEHRQPHAGIDF